MDRQTLLGLNHYVNKNGVIVFEVPTPQKANESIAEILTKYSDFKTALFLSGGTTPKKLYEYFAGEKTLKAGAVGQIDERYGVRNHKNSNEVMITGTGLTAYFEDKNIRFYPMLEQNVEIKNAAKDYDEALRFILKYFPKSVGILGIGEDGHTAGLPSGNQKSKVKSQKAKEVIERINNDQSSLVSYYELEDYGQRITMNFAGISMLDLIIILVLGQEKREALKLMFDEGPVEDCPARFYLKPEIAEKTILITDQIV